MINFDDYTNKNNIEHKEKWQYIPDHSYRIIIIGSSRSGKTNTLPNLIKEQPEIDKIYLYAKDPYGPKYQFLINKREGTRLKHSDDPNVFVEYSNNMDDAYKNIDEYNSNIKRKVLIIFDDMIADIINNKKLNPVVTKLFIRSKKLNVSLAFITQSNFKVPKDVFFVL